MCIYHSKVHSHDSLYEELLSENEQKSKTMWKVGMGLKQLNSMVQERESLISTMKEETERLKVIAVEKEKKLNDARKKLEVEVENVAHCKKRITELEIQNKKNEQNFAETKRELHDKNIKVSRLEESVSHFMDQNQQLKNNLKVEKGKGDVETLGEGLA